jgi:hypothetical protein
MQAQLGIDGDWRLSPASVLLWLKQGGRRRAKKTADGNRR